MDDDANANDIRIKGMYEFPGTDLRCAPKCPSKIYRDEEWDSIDAAGAAFAALSAVGALLFLATLLKADCKGEDDPSTAWAAVAALVAVYSAVRAGVWGTSGGLALLGPFRTSFRPTMRSATGRLRRRCTRSGPRRLEGLRRVG